MRLSCGCLSPLGIQLVAYRRQSPPKKRGFLRNAEVLLGLRDMPSEANGEVRRKHIAYGASKSKDGPPLKCKRLDGRAERDLLRTML